MRKRAPWVAKSPPELASERILDAAGRCFERLGVVATTLGRVADEAGCSRPTVYRYFADRTELRRAFVDREARRLGRAIAERAARTRDPEKRVVDAVLAALAAVRADPTLAAWFQPTGVGSATDLAMRSTVIESLAAEVLGDPIGRDLQLRTRWLVRVLVSFLALPGADAHEERTLVTRFVAPLVVDAGRRGPASSSRSRATPGRAERRTAARR
jgi:AcrR family transcriptional regulator